MSRPFEHETERVATLIRTLGLAPHPEGGWYRRTFRSAAPMQADDGGPPRVALTAIVYLLPGGGISRWHRVTSDETWHHHEGATLELFDLDPASGDCIVQRLGGLADAAFPQHTIAASHWQAARAGSGYALVGCSVAPGFEFDDFALLADMPALAQQLLRDDDRLRALL